MTRDSVTGVTAVWSRWTTRVAGPARTYLPAALAFAGAFLPAVPDPTWYLPETLGLASLPALPFAAVVGLVAAAAAGVSRRLLWPLVLVAAVDCLIRSPGPILALASYIAAVGCRRTSRLVWYAVGMSVVALVPASDREVPLDASLGAMALYVWLPIMAGLWTIARRQVLRQLRERAEQVEREQAARVAQARAQERTRIARDMHDVLAHRVSLMVLHAGALQVSTADPAAAACAEQIGAMGRDALAQLRAVLGVLVEPAPGQPGGADGPAVELPPTLRDLDRLLELSRAVGVQIERLDRGLPYPLPSLVEHTLHRVVREALTNIHKHAGAVSGRVTVDYRPRTVEVTITNAAPHGRPPELPGTRLGLLGLRQRVELLGGEFTAGSDTDGGFIVCARLPT